MGPVASGDPDDQARLRQSDYRVVRQAQQNSVTRSIPVRSATEAKA
jgi:hypothetical protein